MDFGKGYWKTFRQGLEREWLITNGVGGFAGSTIIGANARAQHGLLVASLHAPVQRTLILSKLDESIQLGTAGKSYSFGANERPGWEENGHHHLQRFRLRHGLPTYRYQVEDFFLDKRIAMVYGSNTVVIGYEVRNGARPAVMTVRPLVNYRPYGEQSTRYDLQFREQLGGSELELVPARNEAVTIRLRSERGQFADAPKTFFEQMGMKVYHHSCYDEHMQYHYELIDGKAGIDCHYVPSLLRVEFAPYEHTRFALVCTIDEAGLPEQTGWELIAAEEARQRELISHAELGEIATTGDLPVLEQLVLAADQFIVHRASTGMKTILAGYPWFADWGRDTMIALQGLTLPTGRLDDARDILWTFAKYVRNGLVPNMFPDEGQDPIYNTVDASLWYFHSVHEFLRYSDRAADVEFVREQIYPVLIQIVQAYRDGTDFSIGMDRQDGLIAAGSGLDQVTWMDVRVDGIVVTPRHGKPVEINALWYNALCVMADLAERFGDDSKTYRALAKRVSESFKRLFWNERDQCLFDVVSREGAGDPQIRPNQIWAVSLPYTILPREQARKVVDKVLQSLYATYGLRSLSPDDPEYKPYYGGKLLQRDLAYHQGTVWSFPLGALITAYCKVHEYSEQSIDYARCLLEPFADHLRDGCVGQIAEIFDGNEPIISRGCYAQAWGVGEILRAWVEDVCWRGKLPVNRNYLTG